MQVTETLNEGLKRELTIVVPANELETRLMDRLNEIKDTVRLDGFRPGKVPVPHLRKVYGRSVLAEIIEKSVNDDSMKAIDERGEKPALQPTIAFSEDKKEVEAVMAGKADLSYVVKFEIIPAIEPMDFKKLKLEKLVTEVADDEVLEALDRLAAEQRDYSDRGADAKARQGDRVTIDFEGRVGGETFEGGTANDAPLELGSNSFIPGFEDQLVGAKSGDDVEVKVTFPDDYGVATLSGKDAVFAVKVKEIAEPAELEVDDVFAERLGVENLDALRDAIKQQIGEQYDQVSNERLKRTLLDALDDAHDFPLPEQLIDQEFEQVWQQVNEDMKKAGRTFADDDTTEDDARVEFKNIAARRVRLGLLMGHVGEAQDIQVSDDEVNKVLMEQVRQYPGQEKQVYEHYQKNPEALASLRAPVFEQKVVNFIVELADVKQKKVDREQLFALPEDDTDDKLTKKTKAKPAAKKAKAKPVAKKPAGKPAKKPAKKPAEKQA